MLLEPDEYTKIFPGAQSAWNDESQVYELRTHFRNQIPQLVSEIESVHENLNEKKVLDLGCGPGRLVEAFPEMRFYLGIDQSRAMIDVARKKYPQYHFICSRIEDYRNPNHFDAVTCIDVLQHLENPPEQLLRRVLVLFNADIFIFRTHVNALQHRLVHGKSTGEASASYPMSYFASVAKAINERTDCTAKIHLTKVPKEQRAGAVYITCERRPI